MNFVSEAACISSSIVVSVVQKGLISVKISKDQLQDLLPKRESRFLLLVVQC